MSTRRTLSHFRRSKSGVSTILGTLFFVGILFTCVIPLFLYVNQANSRYDKTVVELRYIDEEGERERLDVYAYPLSVESDTLNVYIKNRSPLAVNVVRVWVNDTPFDRVAEVPAMQEYTITAIPVQLPPPGVCYVFTVKVTTARGNSFASFTNPLYYQDGWRGGMGFTIHVVIGTARRGTYFFHVEVTGPSDFTYGEDAVKRPHESTCFTVVTVTLAGTYRVTVKEGERIWGDQEVSVDLSQPARWVYVEA